MIRVIIMDINNEKWYQSRRVWAAGLTALSVVLVTAFPEQYELIATLAMAGASVLGLSSWTMPKNK